jgi:hypothetical protein
MRSVREWIICHWCCIRFHSFFIVFRGVIECIRVLSWIGCLLWCRSWLHSHRVDSRFSRCLGSWRCNGKIRCCVDRLGNLVNGLGSIARIRDMRRRCCRRVWYCRFFQNRNRVNAFWWYLGRGIALVCCFCFSCYWVLIDCYLLGIYFNYGLVMEGFTFDDMFLFYNCYKSIILY